MRGESDTSSSERERWRQVILGFVSIFVIAIAEGAYLIMIVSYLERSRVPVNQIGAILAFLSGLEAITTLGAGFVLRRWPLLVTLTVPLLMQAASAAILIFQPLGLAVWVSAGLNGLGMGLVGVALYTTTLDRRPAGLRLGTTVGWYTGFIAAGNGVGALLSGLLADKWGFPAFVLSTACFLLATVLSVILQVLPAVPAPEPEPIHSPPNPAGSPCRLGPGWPRRSLHSAWRGLTQRSRYSSRCTDSTRA